MRLSHPGVSRLLFLSILALALVPHAGRSDCSLTSTGNLPLPDLGPGFYKGFIGGLYPGGANIRPPAHEAAGLVAASQIEPLDALGQPNSVTGKIGLTSIGMSSVTQEWLDDGTVTFEPRANADPSKNPQVAIVDGAKGGEDATAWADLNNPVWKNFQQRLTETGLTAQQVQVAWFEEAIKYPSSLGAFPVHAQLLQGYLETILRNLKTTCPNLRIVYISSRDRAYTDDPSSLGPEPYAYESSFAVQWTIADQINGTGNLNFDPAKGAVVAPYISWGPYTWVDGINPRSDELTWLCSDLESDFIHPSDTGSQKVADQLLAFFKTDTTATPWFLQPHPPQPPQLTASSVPKQGAVATDFHFSASATSAGHTIVSYQWTFDDGTFSDSQNPIKQFRAVGNYSATVTVTDAVGNYKTVAVPVTVTAGPTPTPSPTVSPTSTPSPTVTPTVTPTPSPTPPPARGSLLNISTRGEVTVGNGALIGGFIVQGSSPRTILLRAIGPSLGGFGVSDVLDDPTLELHNSAGTTIGSNDNWETTQLGGVITSDQVAAIRATGIPPADARESALIANLNPGLYTAVVRGLGNSSGIGLAELYDLSPVATGQLANISTRGEVLTADQVLIGGFIVGGPNSSLILARALGPSLTGSGVSDALPDPTLELRNSNGTLLGSNDNWTDTNEAAILATGAAPTNPKESAILELLPPGNYTATVTGKDGATGIGLVEVYNLP